MNVTKPKFWKLSHGIQNNFTFADMLSCIEEKLVYVGINTNAKGSSSKTQAEHFIDANIGDYFYLTHGNEGIYLLGQFTGAANYFSKYGEGYVDRPFRVIQFATRLQPYDDVEKWWTPNHNSTFVQIPEDELPLFEEKILKKYFPDLDLTHFQK